MAYGVDAVLKMADVEVKWVARLPRLGRVRGSPSDSDGHNDPFVKAISLPPPPHTPLHRKRQLEKTVHRCGQHPSYIREESDLRPTPNRRRRAGRKLFKNSLVK